MKRLLLAVALVFSLCVIAPAAEQISKSTLRLYRFGRQGTTVSQHMNKVWSDPEIKRVVDRFADHCYFDVDNPKAVKYFKKYHVEKIPTLLVVDEDGKVVKWARGTMTKKEIEGFLGTIEVSNGPVKPVDFGATLAVAGVVLLLLWLFGWL